MNFLNIGYIDCGGVMNKWQTLFNKYSKRHRMRSLVETAGNKYFPVDLLPDSDELKKVIENTDVFIFHPVIKEAHLISKGIINDGINSAICGIDWKEATRDKKVYAFLNGSTNLRHHKNEYGEILFSQYSKIFCSTPDIAELFPFAKYIPVPLLKDFSRLPKKERMICHFPTNREIKNTKEYESVCSELIKEGYKLSSHTISHMSNEEVMAFKKKCVFCFDHMQGYYGINTLEAALVGCVPLVGANKNSRDMLKTYVDSDTFPFDIVTTKDELKNTIKYYLDNPKELHKQSIFLINWMKKYWNPKNHFKKFLELLLLPVPNENGEKDFLSILMTAYNRVNSLSNALYSILEQEIPLDYEIVIVDDGSTDNTKEVIDKFKKKLPIRYIYNYKPKNTFVNPGIPHNIGLAYCKGNIILQSGADIIIWENTITKLYNALKRENCLLSAKVYKIPIKELDKITQNPAFFETVKVASNLYPIHYEKGDYANATPFCSIYKKNWAYKIGLYDEEYHLGGGDDCDFIYRMQKIVKTKWFLEAEVSHQDHKKYGGHKRNEKKYKQNLIRLNNAKKGISNRWRKKILFLGSFNFFKTPGFLWDSLRQQFLRLGHECYFYDPTPVCESTSEMIDELRSYAKRWRDEKALKEVEGLLTFFNPDIVFAGIPPAYEILEKLRANSKAFFVCWYGDMRRPEEFKISKGVFDLMFLTNKGQVKVYEKLLGCKVCPILFGVSSTAHHKFDLDKKFIIGFAGQIENKLHQYRNSLIKRISHLEVINNHWYETNQFYNQCKILISDSCDLAIDEQIEDYTSNRFFNIMGSGGFCLVRYFKGLENLGINNKHFEWFRTEQDCLNSIKWFLDNPAEREEIAKAGYEYFHRVHSWKKRALYMNKVLKKAWEKKNGIK